jgi:FAD/FMN-containing dehydrogenase
MLTSVSPEFLELLAAALPPGCVRPVEARYLEEPRGRWKGQGAAVVAPSTVEDVAVILRLASEARVGVVPFGGGTGLVGGQVAPEGPAPLILSLERMTAIRGVWPDENVIVAEAGAVVADIQSAAEAAGRLFPLSYGAEGSARIGGALAVNSGGVNVLRYGNTRDLCLGIEAVLPDGRILHGLRRLRKDNTGYDIRNLLIGSEGTLGVITAASLRLFPRPARTGVALFAVSGPEAALSLLARARDAVGEGVSAFELMSGTGLGFLDEAGMGLRQPFEPIPHWVALVELGLPQALDPDAELETLFAQGHEAGEVSDGLVAQSFQQQAEFWRLREAVPEANRKIGAVASHDISLPLSEIPRFFGEATDAIRAIAPLRINAFGHLGDGNLHYNVFPPHGIPARNMDAVRERVSEVVHDLVHGLGGSFSAEHGVGRLKTGDLERYGDPVRLDLMRRIKTLFDPEGIMNPGAVMRRDDPA